MKLKFLISKLQEYEKELGGDVEVYYNAIKDYYYINQVLLGEFECPDEPYLILEQ
jgi:hypothetical protein